MGFDKDRFSGDKRITDECRVRFGKRGGACRSHMHLGNPKNGSNIDGQATTEHIGRGGRRLFVVFDEMAAMEQAAAADQGISDAERRILDEVKQRVEAIAAWAQQLAAAQPTSTPGAEPVTIEVREVAYEQIAGRAYGELDPKLPGNAIIQDIELAKDADGKVRYMASFVIYKPVNLKDASGLMWHDVPNRGRVFPYAEQEFAAGDIGLASAWQGDNAGATTVKPKASIDGLQFLQVPIARNADGSPVKGQVFARIVNRAGPASQPLMVQTNPVPYKPASLNSGDARLVTRDAMIGVVPVTVDTGDVQ